MVDNTNQQPNIERVRDLLSPYLDGEVTDEERALVEEAIATSPELREDLETLRQTVALVASLPRVAAPRPFTLSEADVSAAALAPKKYFGLLPAWASGLAVLAAALVCVLAAGGIFLRGQFSGAPAGEIAHLTAEQPAAEEAPAAEKEMMVEKEAELEAPQEEAAAEEAAPTEPSDKEEFAAEAPATAAPTEMPAPEEAPAEPSIEVTKEAEKSVADEAAEATAPREDEAAISGEADADRGAEGENYVDTGAAPTSTPAPLPTPSPAVLAVPATEIAEEQAVVEPESAIEPPSGVGAVPLPVPEQPRQEQKEMASRPVEIKNQKLRVTPGLIQIEGMIETVPGSTLVATLQRNEEPFDSWADPASLQTVVQANGQFFFNIQANAAQRNRDLFALEPADYQITITSVGTDAPVIASVFFDTFGLPKVTPLPTATPLSPSPTPPPSPTVIARLTFVPTATPTIRATDVSPTFTFAEGPSPKVPLWSVGAGIVALVGVLVIVGLIVWLVIRRRQ
jgi:hypothetical protein